MKLIYAKGGCSLAVHIMFEEMGIAYDSEILNARDKSNIESATCKSCTPLLELEHGEVLSDCISILQYLAEKDHRIDLIGGAPGSLDKFHCIEWLNFFSAEIHKEVQPLLRKDLPESFRSDLIKSIEKKLNFVNNHLIGKKFLTSHKMTIADMYAIVILHLLEGQKFNMKWYPEIVRYMRLMDENPSVKRAMKLEKNGEAAPYHHFAPSFSENFIELEDYGPSS